MTQKKIPAISVIIPLYNVEKYVGECLDSLLAQTFQDYEVIVVDDCSTDNSAAVVEGYAEKFGGKLRLVRSKVNSGGCATPRNMGLKFSCGEYLFFLDSDDAITKTALEELYSAAEKSGATVVHCEKWYVAENTPNSTKSDLLKTKSWNFKFEPVTAPEFMSQKLEERIHKFVNSGFGWTVWLNLIRRDFILSNNLEFPPLLQSEDVPFSLYILALAEKILCVPTIAYIYRDRENSASREILDVQAQVHKKFGDVMRGIELIDEFMNTVELFRQNPAYKHAVFNFFVNLQLYLIRYVYAQVQPFQLDMSIRRELAQIEDKTALTAFLFGRMNTFNVQLIQQQNLIRQQQAQIRQLQSQIQPQASQQNVGEFKMASEDIFRN